MSHTEAKKENKYRRYHLNYNPFPMTAITAGGTPFPLYEEAAEEKIKDFIYRSYAEDQYASMLVMGDYGFGKTYTLRWIEKNINEKLSQQKVDSAIAIYIENPQSSPRELIAAIISRFGINKYLTMLWGLATKAFREEYELHGKEFADQFKQRQLGLYDRDLVYELFFEERIKDPMRLLRRVSDELVKVKQFNIEKFSEFVYEKVFSPIFGQTEFAVLLSKFNDQGFNASFRDWTALIEFRSPKKSMFVGFSDVDFLKAILRVFNKSGYKRVYLLIDEFEDIHENLKKDKLATYLRTLRDATDGIQEVLSLVLALKPAVVNRIEVVYPGFLYRFSLTSRIDLAGIMETAMRKFVSKILLDSREEGYVNLGIKPFGEDSLKQIYHYTGPNPRLILQMCSDLLFQAGKRGKEKIDKEFVEEYFTMGDPSDAIALDKVWITKKVEKKIEESKEGDEV